jgi:CRISPR/Cas system-associated endonuclease Cas1
MYGTRDFFEWKVHIALLKAELEPYLGFLHSTQFSKPSLVCDFQELYRYLIDDFIICHFVLLRKSDLVLKEEICSSRRRGKRQYLGKKENNAFFKKLNKHFTSVVEVPRMKVGNRQEIETLINDEAFLFAKYLRGEKTHWEPRIAELR